MAKVTIQGFGDVSFPDTMTPEQIQSAIETDILPKMQQQPTVATGPSAPARLGPPQDLSFAEKYVAPAVESLFGSNIQGSPAGRIIQGASDPALGIMQMGAHAVGLGAPVDQRLGNLEQQYQQERAASGSTGFDPLRLAGNVATSSLAPGVTAPATGGMLAQMLRGGLTGAAFNLAQPVTNGDYASEKLKQGAVGGAFGAAAVPVAAGLARIVRPNTGEAAKTLMDSGVTLTPGQTLGGGFQRVEDSMTSVPVIGDFIRDAKNRTLGDFNQAAYSRGLDPISAVRTKLGLSAVNAKSLPPGPDGVLAVKNALGETYDNLLPKLNWKGDPQFSAELNQLEQMAATLPEQEATTFRKVLETNLGRATPTGRMDGQTFKEVESSLGQAAKKFSGSLDPYQKDLGSAFQQALSTFRGALQRSNPQYSGDLQAINEGYANYARIRAAAASAGDKSSGFTPSQLAAAVRSLDKTAGKGATATGTALMQDLSNAGREILPSTVADSGTPLRHAVQLGVGALLGHSVLPEQVGSLMVPAAIGGGIASMPYTGIGQKLTQTILAERPEWAASLAAALRKIGPLLGAAGGAATLPALANGS